MLNKKIKLDEIFKLPNLTLRKTIFKIDNFSLDADLNDLLKIKKLIFLQSQICQKTEQEIIVNLRFNSDDQGDKSGRMEINKNIRVYEKLAFYFYSAGLWDKNITAKNLIVSFPQVFGKENDSENEIDAVFNLDLAKDDLSQFQYSLLNNPTYNIRFLPDTPIYNNISLASFKKVAFGGSFDHMHLGHNLLLTTAALACSDYLYIGLTSDEMLSRKDHMSVLQPFEQRANKIKHILNKIGYNKKIEIKKINDQQGGAGTDSTIDALLLTEETKSGGEFVNNLRKENKLKPLDLIYARIILSEVNSKVENLTSKISSRYIRQKIKEDNPYINSIFEAWKKFSRDYLKISDERKIINWFSILRDYYTQPWRKYHNLNHIHELLSISYKLSEGKLIKDEVSFYLTLWFHDVIYVPSRKDNEDRSAYLFEEFVKENNLDLSKVLVGKVKKYILHTKYHTIDQFETSQDKDLQLFLDCDVAIFASDPQKYSQYVHLIKDEYADYVTNETQFIEGRKQFVEKILKRKSLFYTKEFHDLYEELARKNLRRELI